MSTTPNLLISHIAASQNQKEVTANTAFDELDEALCGVVSKAMTDADYTVPTADALQNNVIIITGTLTASRNVIVPNNKKPYVFSNQTTGGFPIVVKTAAGTGFTLTSQDYVPLICDGTNVLKPRATSVLQSSNVDLKTQGAAITATTLLATGTSPGQRLYRISYVAKLTRVATTSSVLGGTNGFQVVYTDADDSVVTTTVAGATSSLNTTQAVISGELIVNAKVSTNIQYKFDYTSVGGTTMQYSLHVRIEAL